jgi:hypothetical protein
MISVFASILKVKKLNLTSDECMVNNGKSTRYFMVSHIKYISHVINLKIYYKE